MKRNALLVGFFVIAALLLTVIATLWLSGNSLFQRQQRAYVYFDGAVSGLYVGAPVTFRGVSIGQVDEIRIMIERSTLKASIPVRLRLRPEAVAHESGTTAARPTLEVLVERGLRARLVAQSFVTGQRAIDLDFYPDAPLQYTSTDHEEEIPTLSDRFGALIDQVAELPLRDTVQQLRDTLTALQGTLVSTQQALDGTVGEIGTTAAEARRTLGVAAEAIRSVEGQANRTMASVSRLAGSVEALSETTRGTVTGIQPQVQGTLDAAREAADAARVAMQRVAELTAPGTPARSDLETALRDMAQAARGLREWSELLEQQPNAVIFGADRP